VAGGLELPFETKKLIPKLWQENAAAFLCSFPTENSLANDGANGNLPGFRRFVPRSRQIKARKLMINRPSNLPLGSHWGSFGIGNGLFLGFSFESNTRAFSFAPLKPLGPEPVTQQRQRYFGYLETETAVFTSIHTF